MDILADSVKLRKINDASSMIEGCHIDLVPLGGLCNRMRAVASAIYLAQISNGSVSIHWQSNAECNAYFDELFEPIDLPFVQVFRLHSWKLPLIPARKKNLRLPVFLRKYRYDAQFFVSHDRTDDSLLDLLRGKRFYICSGHSLSTHYPLSDHFKPLPSLLERIHTIRSVFEPDVVGVHIRRGDHKRCIEHCSELDFMRSMDDALLLNPNTLFYVATDSVTLKSKLLERYGASVIYQTAELNRASLQGIQDAVVDLWCLASTSRIIGSPFSSYSDLAAELGRLVLQYPQSYVV
jgi:hypothetical protein